MLQSYDSLSQDCHQWQSEGGGKMNRDNDVRITITIYHPALEIHSYQMVLDKLRMDDLYYLRQPINAEFLPMPERIFEYHRWREKNERAHKLVDSIANNIAYAMLHTLGDKLKELYNDR